METGIAVTNTFFFVVFAGYFAGLFFHHIILFAHTREKIYLNYFLYILLLFGTVSTANEFSDKTAVYVTLNALFLQLFHAALILFTAFIMDIHKLSERLYATTRQIAVIILAGLTALFFGKTGFYIAGVFALFSLLYSLYLALFAAKRSVTGARLYLWASLPLFIPMAFHALAHNIVFIEDLPLFFELVVAGAMWNMLLLSFILAKKAKQLQAERERALIRNEADSDILFLQSRYASMGETVGNIAHQWKQPLNAIGAIHTGIKATLLYQDEIAKEKLMRSVDSSFEILRHLAETIDTFYGFLSPKENQTGTFNISTELEAIRKITEYSFENSNIELRFELHTDPEIQGNANEFMHALLNLILNAKDAFDTAETKEPRITVLVTDDGNTCVVTVSDNAGGIRIEPLDMIFDLHVSSKEDGSGLGLFMTKNIIEKRFGGTIRVENKEGGACFTLELPYREYKNHRLTPHETYQKKSLAYIKQLTQKVIELEELEKTFKKWADTFWQVEWGLVIYNPLDGTVELMNPAFAKMHGYTRGELMGKPVTIVCAAECLDEWNRHSDTLQQKGHHTFEATNIRKDGSRFPVTFDISEIKDEAGESRYFIASVRDITLQQEADELLRLKRFALNHIRDEVFLIDGNGRFHYVNDGACEELGYIRENLLSMSILDIDPDFSAEMWPVLWDKVKREKNLLMQSRHRRSDGSTFPIEVSGDYFEYNGKGYILSIARDITERLIAERKKSDERMRLFFERQLVGMAIASPGKQWLQVNKKLEEMLGYTFEELKTMTWADLTHPDDLMDNDNLAEKMLKGEIEHYALEKRYIRKDGGIIHANVSVGCVRKEDGSVEYVLAIIEDITERKLMEESLRKNREFLAEAQRISHTGSWELDLENNVLSWSDEIFRIFEIDQNRFDASYEAFLQTVHPKDRDTVNKAFTESLEQQTPYELEHRLLMPDGRIKYVLERGETQYAENGKPLYTLGTVHDITERKQMETMLKESEARYRISSNLLQSVMESSSDVTVFALDTEYRYLTFNQLHRDFYKNKWDVDVAIGKSFLDLVKDEAFGEFAKGAFDKALAGDTFSVMSEEDIVRNGQPVIEYWDNYLSPIFNDEKQVIGLTVFSINITERKGMETALEENRRALAEAQKLSHIGSWKMDMQTGEISWSDEYFRILEINPESMENFFEIFMERVHPEDRTFIAKRYAHWQQTLESYETEHRLLMPDSRVKYVLQRSVTLHDEMNNALYVVGTMQDITERKEMEEALRQSEEQFRTLADNIPDPIFQYDRKGRRVYVNNAVLEFTQKSREELLGGITTDQKVVDDEHGRKMREIILRVVATGKDEAIESRVMGPDGKPHYFTNRYVPVPGTNDTIESVIMIAQDITAHKNVEELFEAVQASKEELKELNATLEQKVEKRTAQLSIKEREFRTLAENLPDFLVRYDKECRRVYVNPAFSEYFGIPVDKLLGSTTETSPLAGTPSALSEKVRHVLMTGEKADLETFTDRNGKRRWWNIVFTPEFDDNSEVTAVLSIAHDITAIKEAEIELREREEKFSSVFRLSPAAVSVTSLERGVYLEVNDSFLYHTKYTRDEVVGHSSSDLNIFVNPEDREAFFKEVTEKGFIQNFEYAYRAKDGSIGYAAAFASIITLKGEKCLLAHSYDISSRKKVEALQQERLELEVRLSKIAANAPGVNYIFELRPDETMVFTYVAPGIEELTGISAEMMMSNIDTATANCYPEDHDGVLESLAVSARDLTPWSREYRVLHPQKGEIWIEGQATPEKQPDGTIVWYGFFHDITERKTAEREIRLLERALESTEESIWLFDISDNGRLVYVNEGASRMLGYSRDELLAMGIIGIDKEYSPEEAAAGVEELKRNKHIVFERLHTTKDGRKIPVEIDNSLFEMEGTMYVLSTARDISAKKEL